MRTKRSIELNKFASALLLFGAMWSLASHAQPVAGLNQSRSTVTALCDAMQSGDWPEALRIAKAGGGATNIDQRGRYPLAVLTHRWFSAGSNQPAQLLLRELLDKGADPFVAGFSGFNPNQGLALVEESLRFSDQSLADCYLTNRVSPSRLTPQGDTALHLAAKAGRTNVINFLLSAGFSVDQTNRDGLTPLQRVVSSAMRGTFVLTNDQPPFFVPFLGKGQSYIPPIHTTVELLLSRGATLDACSAAGMGMTNQLAGLLRRNPTAINLPDGLGCTPLHYAARASQFHTTTMLIRAGADGSLRSKTGASPLHLACAQENAEIVRILLKAGVPVDQPDGDGDTPLHLAAPWGAATCLSQLIDAHASLNRTNKAGKTPLRVAVERGNSPGIKLLLGAGARTDLGLGGETLLHIAARQGAPDPQMGPNETAAENGALSIPLLLRHGLSVDAHDDEGRTPLQRAVTSLNWNAMNLLLTNGANVNEVDVHGNTALHQLSTQIWNYVSMSVSVPLDPAEQKRRYRQPGQWPASLTRTNISVTGWLLDHGANPNLTNHAGLTPLELVCSQHWGHWEKESAANRITLLIKSGAKVSKPGYESLEACLGKIK